MASNASSLPYHEPSITTIVIASGLLLLLNSVNYALDRLVYCGLIGQVFIGIAWGTPGAQLLSREVEDAVVQLGYLGLLLIVYEGGLSTSFRSLRANLLLSAGVAATGVAVPIGLSFVLLPLVRATPLQAFAAGAALCSTSLGTTFVVLRTSGLSATRLGVVLTSAAMMDDVVGLVMVQVISNLGGGLSVVALVRPVLVSLGLAAVVPLACAFIVLPVAVRLYSAGENDPGAMLYKILRQRQAAFVIQTVWLVGLVVGGTFVGTSSLLCSYVAGATVSWWDSEVRQAVSRDGTGVGTAPGQAIIQAPEASGASAESPAVGEIGSPAAAATTETGHASSGTGSEIYERYYHQAVERILKPFFFASIGFSVPITRMFSGPIIWRGIVYTVLMVISKMLCGVWLISFASPLQIVQHLFKLLSGTAGKSRLTRLRAGAQHAGSTSGSSPGRQESEPSRQEQVEPNTTREGEILRRTLQSSDSHHRPGRGPENASPGAKMPVSVYPACILGLAMVARGEIGYLISALAESKGIFGGSGSGSGGSLGEPSELFLIVTWAISVCTIVGPICFGLLVNRVKRLETRSEKGKAGGGRHVLGAWGMQ